MESSNIKKLGELLNLMKTSSVEPPDQKLSIDIISALRYGVVPDKGVLKFSVGREDLLTLIKQDLRQVGNGYSSLRFINGRYGSGKTHILYVLREFAFKNNFATSLITLTPRECPLYDLGVVYSHIVKSLRTNNCRSIPALETVIKNWADRLLSLGAYHLQNVLYKIKQLSTDFQNVLTYYIESSKKGAWQNADFAIRWIQGDLRTKRDSKTVGACNYACDQTALGMLQNIVMMLKVIGYNGLVILLDEAETIPSIHRASKVQQAYNNLGKLINCNVETSNSYFIYATTPLFFEDLQSYCLPDISEKNIVHLQPLPIVALKKLALHIRDLHIQAYKWSNINRVSNQNIIKFVDKFLTCNEKGTIARDFVRAMVASLDVCQEDPKLIITQALSPGN